MLMQPVVDSLRHSTVEILVDGKSSDDNNAYRRVITFC